MNLKLPQLLLITVMLAVTLPACKHEPKVERAQGETVLVFKHGKIAGDPAAFRRLLDQFEKEHPGIRVRDEALPASTDEQHQFYAVNLESKSTDIDVLALDVIWVPEFARAGWIRDVTHLLAPGEQAAFFPGPIRAVTYRSRLYAIPWYIDAGVLYVRKDLLEKYRKPVPRTWQELVTTAREITRSEPGIYGYLWQGKQYEGLVCNVLEFIWSNGGDVMSEGKPVIADKRNEEAIAFMRDLIGQYRVTPPLVTTAIEEPTRQLFGSGKVLFMRNWPYAWSIFNSSSSPVRGKVGLSPLPAFPGHDSVSTLGGWQLGVNAYSLHPAAGEELVRFLASTGSQKELALTVGYKPTRKDLYKDKDLLREQSDLAQLFTIFMQARPRPVTPYYMMITGVLQPEFSAVISGIRKPGDALASAQKQVEHLLGAGP